MHHTFLKGKLFSLKQLLKEGIMMLSNSKKIAKGNILNLIKSSNHTLMLLKSELVNTKLKMEQAMKIDIRELNRRLICDIEAEK
jgi:hypothetical protein